MICISNGEHTFYDLKERVRSRLLPARIEFRPYSQEDVVAILRQKAEQALHSGTWREDALKRIARFSHGDVRIAIRMLRYAAEYAEREGGKIEERHIKPDFSQTKTRRGTHLCKRLSNHHVMLYRIIKARPGIVSGRLWAVYREECKRKKEKPVARRTFSAYLRKMEQLRLIRPKRAAVRGRVRSFRVRE